MLAITPWRVLHRPTGCCVKMAHVFSSANFRNLGPRFCQPQYCTAPKRMQTFLTRKNTKYCFVMTKARSFWMNGILQNYYVWCTSSRGNSSRAGPSSTGTTGVKGGLSIRTAVCEDPLSSQGQQFQGSPSPTGEQLLVKSPWRWHGAGRVLPTSRQWCQMALVRWQKTGSNTGFIGNSGATRTETSDSWAPACRQGCSRKWGASQERMQINLWRRETVEIRDSLDVNYSITWRRIMYEREKCWSRCWTSTSSAIKMEPWWWI
jgi:hypothetical protein